MRRLHDADARVATAATMRDALEHAPAAAIELHGADFGNVQLLDHGHQQLAASSRSRDSASRSSSASASVGADDDSACGRALRTRGIGQIGDVTAGRRTTRRIAAPPPRPAIAPCSRCRSSVATATLVGVLSVHFREPHAFSERDRQLGDLLGRQAADLIETRAHQESLQQLNEALRQRTGELEASRAGSRGRPTELRQQDRNREEFLAALGHELSNPLAAIQSSLALLSVLGRPLAPRAQRSARGRRST